MAHIAGSIVRQRLRRLLQAAAVFAAILFCIAIVDKPLATFTAWHPVRFHGSRFIVGTPGLLVGFALAMPFLVWWRTPETGWRRLALLCSSSVLWTAAAVELIMKPIFGRSGPVSWVERQEFAFHWFEGRQAQLRSMPSGEMALLAAVLGVLWIAYPRYRWMYVLIAMLEALGLIWLRWHFASDVIAGLAMGALGSVLAFQYSSLPLHKSR